MSLQRGMNFQSGGRPSIILMSVRKGAPYADRLEDDGRVLIYEGHDIPRKRGGPDPKSVDQPGSLPSGKPTQNGLFAQAAEAFTGGVAGPELVRVYEKIKPGIWTFNGVFQLRDVWQEGSDGRQVFKFRLELVNDQVPEGRDETDDLAHSRMIPSSVKLEVWKRDEGKCVECGSPDNLHFDHILPFSKGGTSLKSENIQLLCARHNLAKSDRIE
ncbi:MAG: HNH endonuclease [Solirubrobacterales bacterium]